MAYVEIGLPVSLCGALPRVFGDQCGTVTNRDILIVAPAYAALPVCSPGTYGYPLIRSGLNSTGEKHVMGNFKSIISGIWNGFVKAEPVIEGAAKALITGAAPVFALIDPIIGNLTNTIVTVEANAPEGTSGADKFAAVFADFKSGADLANAVLAADGKQLVYDPTSFAAGTNAFVEAMRQFAVLKASVRIESIPKS